MRPVILLLALSLALCLPSVAHAHSHRAGSLPHAFRQRHGYTIVHGYVRKNGNYVRSYGRMPRTRRR